MVTACKRRRLARKRRRSYELLLHSPPNFTLKLTRGRPFPQG